MKGVYLVELEGALSNRLYLFEKINNVFVETLSFEQADPLDLVVLDRLKKVVKQYGTLQIEERPSRNYYEVPQEIGDIIKYYLLLRTSVNDLEEKTLLFEQTQMITLLREGKFRELRDKLSLLIVTKQLNKR